MNLLPKKKRLLSEKNGEIIVRTFLGRTTITVANCYQSGSPGTYIPSMWDKALSLDVDEKKDPTFLLLGLGAGNVVSLLQKKYNKPKITVIEWDEKMITLAKKLHFYDEENVQVLLGDAITEIKAISETYTLIIIDLFTGDKVEPRLVSSDFLASLKDILKEDGKILVNFYRQKGLILPFREFFTEKKQTIYKYNTLVLFNRK